MQQIECQSTPTKIAPIPTESPLVCNEHCRMDMDARVYSKDFLLKYSGCKKDDNEIAERMKHLLSPNNKIRLNSSDGAIKKHKPITEGRVDRNIAGSCKISRYGETSSPKFQRENITSSPKIQRENITGSPKPQRENINLLKSSANNWKKQSPQVSVSPPMNRRNQKPLSPITPNRNYNNIQEASIVKKISYANVAREQPSSPNEPKTSSPGIAEAIPSPSPYKTPLELNPLPLDDANTSAKQRSGRKLPSPLDNHRVSQRHKQIEYGYKTVGYLRYRLLVPKECRTPDQPRTPRKDQACSKRSWDGQLKKWRRELHRWDPEDMKSFQFLLESDVVGAIISRSQELSSIIDDVKRKLIEDPSKALGGDDSDDLSDKENSLADQPLSPVQDSPNQGMESEINYENIVRALVF